LERLVELTEVLLEARRDAEQAAVLPAQVLEVQRPGLRSGELGVEHREHALPDDARLDQAARVDPDDAGAVRERVEVPGPGLAGVGLGSARGPDGRVAELGEIDAAPLLRVLRVRADEEPDPAE